jgi:molybdopterin synthase sulfur carrier subunit
VIVRYFADIRELTGRAEEAFSKAAPTLRALVAELATAHGAAFEKRLLEGGGLSSTIIVLVDGRNVEHLAGLDTPLGPDAAVAIFPMVAGG